MRIAVEFAPGDGLDVPHKFAARSSGAYDVTVVPGVEVSVRVKYHDAPAGQSTGGSLTLSPDTARWLAQALTAAADRSTPGPLHYSHSDQSVAK